MLPFSAQELFSQVSLPNWPGRGMVSKRHSSLPVFTSKARTRPLVLLWVSMVAPSFMEEPTITTSPATVGVEWTPISPVSRSICWPFPLTDADLQIDDAVGAEGSDHRAGLGVELDEAIAGRHIDDALVALAVGPIGHAAPRQLPRRDGGALALTQGMRPDHFAGFGIERDHRAPRAGGGVEHALDHDRRAFQLPFRIGTEGIGLEAPGDFRLLKFEASIWDERRVARALDVGGIGRPFAVRGRGLALAGELRGAGVPTNTCASDGGANANVAAAKPKVDTDKRNFRDIISLPSW